MGGQYHFDRQIYGNQMEIRQIMNGNTRKLTENDDKMMCFPYKCLSKCKIFLSK